MSNSRNNNPPWRIEAFIWIGACLFAILASQASPLPSRLLLLAIALLLSGEGAMRISKRSQASRRYALARLARFVCIPGGALLFMFSYWQAWDIQVAQLGLMIAIIAIYKTLQFPAFNTWERQYNQRKLEKATLAEIRAKRRNSDEQ